MDESTRTVAAETASDELLAVIVEIVDAGVPIDVVNEAIELVRVRGAEGLRPAAELLLESLETLDVALLAAAEATVLRSEVAARNRAAALVRVEREPSSHDA